MILSLKHTHRYVDTSQLLAILVAPSRDYKSWLRFLLFDSFHIYVNFLVYITLGCMIAYKVMVVRAHSLSLSLSLSLSRITKIKHQTRHNRYRQDRVFETSWSNIFHTIRFNNGQTPRWTLPVSTMTLRVIDTWYKTKTSGLILWCF